MDYKCTCKRLHLLDVVSQLNRNRVYIELEVKVTIIHATPENYRHVQTYLNEFLGNVLCYIFLHTYVVLPRLFLARDTTLPSYQCLLGKFFKTRGTVCNKDLNVKSTSRLFLSVVSFNLKYL